MNPLHPDHVPAEMSKRFPDRHDPRAAACAAAFSDAAPGDTVRLYGFEGGNWPEGRVLKRHSDGSLEMSLVQRAGGKPGTYLVHVDALEHDVRTAFLDEVRKDLEKSKAGVITRDGVGIRLVDDVWLVRAKKSKEWLPATEAQL